MSRQEMARRAIQKAQAVNPCEASQRGLPCYHKAALGVFLGTIPQSWLPAVDVPVALAVAS